MVHVQNTSISVAAVMSALWFEYIADKAISFASADGVALSESPERRDFAWICEYSLEESPHDHREQNMEYHK